MFRSAGPDDAQRRQHAFDEYHWTNHCWSGRLDGKYSQHLQLVSTRGASRNNVEALIADGARLYIALSFGFSLAVNAWIFFRVSGGLFNPAVSLGMVLVGALTPLRGALLCFVQILGGITVSRHSDATCVGARSLTFGRALQLSKPSPQAPSTSERNSAVVHLSLKVSSSRCS
jgi:hypothetical protein